MTDAETTDGAVLAATLHDAWSAFERILNGNLSAIRGITYSEYRLLSAIAGGLEKGCSRVDLARSVGLSPSAVTRALRPLTELGMVVTTKHERDARLAMARLTPQGEELVADAAGVVDDVASRMVEQTPLANEHRTRLLEMLTELAHL